jgi:hypothetical protein
MSSDINFVSKEEVAIVCQYLKYHMYWPLLSFAIQKTFCLSCNWCSVKTIALYTYLTHSMDPDFGHCDNRVWN